MSQLEIGFLGGGQMARALASGFVQAGRLEAEKIGFLIHPRKRVSFF